MSHFTCYVSVMYLVSMYISDFCFFFSSRRRHTRYWRDWSSDVCSSDLGDRIGRKSTLIATLLLMGLATFAVALVPTYEQVGIWGAVILTVLRFVQDRKSVV